jgi:hypothetical protein
MNYGQSQLLDLSQKETENGLNISQAAIAAAQATKDFNQRQKADLNYQSTVVSLNITQAAATQNYMLQQAKISRDATTAAQNSQATAAQFAYLLSVSQTALAQAFLDSLALQTSQAASSQTAFPLTETYSAYLLNVTGTAEAQAILSGLANQTAQVAAALTAYPQTATPFALTKAALSLQEYGQEQQNFNNQIVNPLTPFLVVLVVLLFIGALVFVFRRSQSLPFPRRLRIGGMQGNRRPMIIDGVIVDQDPPLYLETLAEETNTNPAPQPEQDIPHVEIVNPSEAPFDNWIAEVEDQLASHGASAQ